jgi:DNA repair ATPase RecN
MKALNRQSGRLLGLMGLQMMLPGARSARGLATTAALYMNFMRNVLNPQTVTHRYKVIRVQDYSREIENSLIDLENISVFINKTSRYLRQTIKNFEETYKDYLDSIPEAKELLSNLYQVQSQIEEKEYELEQLKKEQQKNLEKNNQKVKTLDNKRVA